MKMLPIKERAGRVLEVNDAHSCTRVNMGTALEVVKVKKSYHDRSDIVELEDGTWLIGAGDGRYHAMENELGRWAPVMLYEKEIIDGEEEYMSGELIGYTRIHT